MLVYLEDHDIGELGSEPPSGFDWPLFRRASFVRNVYGRLRRASHPLIHQALPAHGWFLDQDGVPRQLFYFNYAALPFTDYEQERFETTKAAFREGLGLARAQGVSLALVFVPMKFRVYSTWCSFAADSPCHQWTPWDLPTRFAAFCAEEDLECVDLSVPMGTAAAAGQLLYAPEDSHWNVAGHAFVADQVLSIWNRLVLDAR